MFRKQVPLPASQLCTCGLPDPFPSCVFRVSSNLGRFCVGILIDSNIEEWKDSSRFRSLGGCGGAEADLDHFVCGRSRLGSLI